MPRHFYPFWDWGFRSPVSHWDLNHQGRIAAPIEAAVVLVCCGLLLMRYCAALWVRLAVGGVMVLYALLLGKRIEFACCLRPSWATTYSRGVSHVNAKELAEHSIGCESCDESDTDCEWDRALCVLHEIGGGG